MRLTAGQSPTVMGSMVRLGTEDEGTLEPSHDDRVPQRAESVDAQDDLVAGF